MSPIINQILKVTVLLCVFNTVLPGFAYGQPPDSSICKINLESAGKDSGDGIYILDESLVGSIPDEFEIAPGRHQVELLFPGRRPRKQNFSCQAGEEKDVRHGPGRKQKDPSWIEQGGRYRVLGDEIRFEGAGASEAWGENIWVQVMLADLRARTDILRMMDNYNTSLRRDYGEKKNFHLQYTAKSVIILSGDPDLIASRFSPPERWLNQDGVIFSHASLRIPLQALTSNASSPPSCADKIRLVFYQEELEEKTLDQTAILLEAGEGGFTEIAQAISRGEGQIWPSTEKIPLPEAKSFCIGDIQRLGRCTSTGADYIESIGLYHYPSLLPLGQLHKDYSSENSYGCQFR